MTSVDRLTALRRIRCYYIGRLTRLSKRLDEYEESSHQGESDIIVIDKRLKEVWMRFEATQQEILELDEEEHTRGLDIADQYNDLVMRVSRHLSSVQQAATSMPTKCESGTDSGPISTPPYNQTPPSSSRKCTPSPTSNTQEQREQWQRRTLQEIHSSAKFLFNPRHRSLSVTAQMSILNHKADPIRCRAMLDTGAVMNFIDENFAKSLGIKLERCCVPIEDCSAIKTTINRYVTTTIINTEGTYKRTLVFFLVPMIVELDPPKPIDRSIIKIPTNLQLADPIFYRPGPIDIVLNVGATLESLCRGQIIIQSNNTDLCLQNTRFGWIIGGSLIAPSTSRN